MELTEKEEQIMRVLWKLEKAFVIVYAGAEIYIDNCSSVPLIINGVHYFNCEGTIDVDIAN